MRSVLKKTVPLPREAIETIDSLLAKHMLVAELNRIPEFSELWRNAREPLGPFIEAVKDALAEIFEAMSAEGRGALLMCDGAYLICGDEAIDEAGKAAAKLQQLQEALQRQGAWADYCLSLESLVEPLGVPCLVDYMMHRDKVQWGFFNFLDPWRSVRGKCKPDATSRGDEEFVAGPLRDLLETMLVKATTDLSPAEAAFELPGRLRHRCKQKVAPLRRHLKRYDLQQRIQLWVQNVIYGKTQVNIAKRLQDDEQRVAAGVDQWEWVRKQIQEASHILGVRRKGRPVKGGVLERWKEMAE